MPLVFRNVRYQAEGLEVEVDLTAPDGVIVGLTGTHPGELQALAHLAAGSIVPSAGEIERGSAFLAAGTFHSAESETIEWWVEAALESSADLLLIGPSLALTDPLFRAWTLERFEALRREGRLILLASQDLALLEQVCDEVIVFDAGRIVERGEARSAMAAYRKLIAAELRDAAEPAELIEGFERHGDARAELVDLDLVGGDGQSRAVFSSGEQVSVKVRVRFAERVEDPVIGIMLRNRIGVAVYGTNTQLEDVHFGPCEAAAEVELIFVFACNLCPQEYTLTVASHDPDGTAHDWLEEAMRFAVVDSRFTAGVANLKARVEVRQAGQLRP